MISTNENLAGASGITEIEKLAKAYAEIRAQRNELAREANEKIEAVKRGVMPLLRKLVTREAEKFSALYAAVEAHPDLFESPRTAVFHGIKVGLQKGKGGIEFDDAEKVCALIRKNFPGDKALAYLRITEEPDKKMLADLPVSELKKLGCTVADTGDVVVIKPTDGALDKIANALLKGAVEEAAEGK